MAGAKVTLTNEGTGVSITTISSSIGEYSFSPVKIGTLLRIGGIQRVSESATE